MPPILFLFADGYAVLLKQLVNRQPFQLPPLCVGQVHYGDNFLDVLAEQPAIILFCWKILRNVDMS